MAKNDGEPPLLPGGNPQIDKGDDDDVVQRYIAAMPGWKHDVGVHRYRCCRICDRGSHGRTRSSTHPAGGVVGDTM